MWPRAGVRVGGYACAWLCAHRGKGRGGRGQQERGTESDMEPHILTERVDILAPIDEVLNQLKRAGWKQAATGEQIVAAPEDGTGRYYLLNPAPTVQAAGDSYTLTYAGHPAWDADGRREHIDGATHVALRVELMPFTAAELAAVQLPLIGPPNGATHIVVTCVHPDYTVVYFQVLDGLEETRLWVMSQYKAGIERHLPELLQEQAPVMQPPRRGRPLSWLGALVRDLVEREVENAAIYELVRRVGPTIEVALPPARNPDGSIVGGTLAERIGDALTRARRGTGTPLNSEPN